MEDIQGKDQEKSQSEINHHIIQQFLNQNLSENLSYAQLNLCISLLTKRNPFYSLQELQFIEKNDKQESIMMKVKDESTQSAMSLQVYFHEKNFAKKYQEIMQLYKAYKYLQRNDLIVDIKSIYILEQYDDPLFLIIEMELMDITYEIYKQIALNKNDDNCYLKNENIQLILNYLNDIMVIQKYREEDIFTFYVKLIGSEIKIKLNIVDSSKFFVHEFLIDNLETESKENNLIRQNLTLYEKNNQKTDITGLKEINKIVDKSLLTNNNHLRENSNFNYEKNENIYKTDIFDRDSKVPTSMKQQNEINQNYCIPIKQFINYLKSSKPQILEAHPQDVFEMIVKHPKYQKISLVESGPNYFILKVFDQNKQYLLKCQKFSSLFKLEKMNKLYEIYTKTVQDLFKQIISFETYIGEQSYYLLVEEDIYSKQLAKTFFEHFKLFQKQSLDLTETLINMLFMKTCFTIKFQNLSQIDMTKCRLLIDSQNNYDYIILAEDPLFMNELIFTNKSHLTKQYVEQIKKQFEVSQIYFDSDLQERSSNRIDYFTLQAHTNNQRARYFEQRISVIQRLLSMIKNESMNSLYKSNKLKENKQFQIQLQLNQSNLINQLKQQGFQYIDELLIEKHTLSNWIDLEYLEGLTLPQYPQLKLLELEFEESLFTQAILRGMKYMFSLFPNLQRLKITIFNQNKSSQSDYNPSLGEAIQQLTNLETLQIKFLNVTFNYFDKERVLLNKSLQNIKTIKSLNIDITTLKNFEEDLNIKLSLIDKINIQAKKFGEQLSINYEFKNKFQQLSSSLELFFSHNKQDYGVYLTLFSLLIHHLQVEVYCEFSEDFNKMNMTISNKNTNLSEIILSFNQWWEKINKIRIDQSDIKIFQLINLFDQSINDQFFPPLVLINNKNKQEIFKMNMVIGIKELKFNFKQVQKISR